MLGVNSIRKLAYTVLRQVLKRVNVTLRLRVSGVRIAVPIVGGLGFSVRKGGDTRILGLFKKVLPHREGAFLDVGVNLGQTLLQVMSVSPGREYYGFEPNVGCCFYVRKLISANAFKNCEVYPIGLSDREGLAKLLLNAESDDTATLVKGFRPKVHYLEERRVLIQRGDDLIESLGITAISIVKIDVEGGELEVIRGLRQTLRRSGPYVVCEFLPVCDEETELGRFRKMRQEEAIGILRDERYSMFRMTHGDGLVPLERIETHSDLSKCEYVFAPNGQDAVLRRLVGG